MVIAEGASRGRCSPAYQSMINVRVEVLPCMVHLHPRVAAGPVRWLWQTVVDCNIQMAAAPTCARIASKTMSETVVCGAIRYQLGKKPCGLQYQMTA